MGVLDVKIEIESWWRERNHRLERLKRVPPAGNTHPSTDPSSSSSSTNNGETQPENSAPEPVCQEATKGRIMPLKLYWAARRNNVDGFLTAMEEVSAEMGLPCTEIFKQVSPSGNSLLHLAAKSGGEKTVRLIAYHYPSLLMKQNLQGDTALHLAARAGHYSVVNILVRLREDWVHLLASDSEIQTLRSLPQDRKLLRVRNGNGNTALHEALMNEQKWLPFVLGGEDPELSCYLNNEGKSPIYLAAEVGNRHYLDSMLRISDRIENKDDRLKGRSPLLAAIMKRNKGLIDLILENELRYINLQDEEGRTPLHHAASMGYIDEVCYLLSKGASSSMQRDNNGFFPVQLAAMEGHVQVLEELLQHCPDAGEMLNRNGDNILHLAAENGKKNVVDYVFRTSTLGCLLNEKNCNGDTPLHLATVNWHPEIVSRMTWDKRVDLKILNNEGFTALNAAEFYMEKSASFHMLTRTALKAAGAPRAPRRIQAPKPRRQDRYASDSQPLNTENYKERVNTLLLVSTLVATVTFAAGFTMPGGYNSSDPDQGIATLLLHNAFYIFVLCDTIAMYSSIMVAVTLIWAQLGDSNLVLNALRLAHPLLGFALAMVSLAFMAGVYLVVSKLKWLAYTVLTMGLIFLVTLLALFCPLCFPYASRNCFLRYLTYYPFHLLVLVTCQRNKDQVVGWAKQ